MVSNIIIKNGVYHCSNCMMKVCPVMPKCKFCECWFSNYEDIILGRFQDAYANKVKEEFKNESNIS